MSLERQKKSVAVLEIDHSTVRSSTKHISVNGDSRLCQLMA